MAYSGPWRNGWSQTKYVQICRPDELEPFNPKLLALILKYKTMFDDEWHYWITKSGWIKRAPSWLPGKTTLSEKPRRHDPTKPLDSFNGDL